MPGSSETRPLTRRDFVRTAGVTAAAATWASSLPRWAHADASAPMRIGLIGCGGRGTGAAENCLQSAPNVHLVALADLLPDRLAKCRQNLTDPDREGGPLPMAKIADDHCFVGFDAYRKLVALPDVDLVLLATPPGFRPIHFAEAVESGKHVFMEKPVAVDPVGVRKILAAGEKAAEKGLGVVAGTQYRHQVSFRETIRRVHDGAIGDILAARCYYNTTAINPSVVRTPGMTDMEWQVRKWYTFDWLSGDHIVEQHIHTIDVCNWVLRAHPVRAVGVGGRQVPIDPANGNIYDHFAVDFEYPNGVHLMSMCRQMDGTDGNRGAYFVGTRGKADPYDAKIEGAAPWAYDAKPNIQQAYVREHADLIESIRGGKPINEARQVAESTLTGILGRQAAYTGKTITWEEMLSSPLDWSPAKYEFGPLPHRAIPIPGKQG